MFLFLDFDGVLHPQFEGMPTPVEHLFCHVPRFEGVMRDFPQVRIVISSTWRHQFALDHLRTYFSPDIAARITDATPQTNPDDYRPARREDEILAWLAATGNESVPWIALDDATWQFDRHRDRVVGCTWYVGLDEAAAARLRDALTAHATHGV